MRTLRTIVVLGVLALLVIGCVPPQEAPPVEETEAPVEEPLAEETPVEEAAPEEEEEVAPPAEEEEEAADEVEVAMESNVYVPQEITIAPGTTVTWINNDAYDHTVTSGARDNPTAMFDETVGPDESFSFTFEEAGTYEYFCSIHPGMDGTVIVE